MKANELMIGDWVYSSFYYNSTKPCRITGIRTFDIKDVYAFVYIDKVEDIKDINSLTPIPLTPEILEKNGFKKDEKREEMYYWNWSICDDCVSYDKETHTIRIFHTLGRLVFVEPLSYVHELQHALRLCGINKEITL